MLEFKVSKQVLLLLLLLLVSNRMLRSRYSRKWNPILSWCWGCEGNVKVMRFGFEEFGLDG